MKCASSLLTGGSFRYSGMLLDHIGVDGKHPHRFLPPDEQYQNQLIIMPGDRLKSTAKGIPQPAIKISSVFSPFYSESGRGLVRARRIDHLIISQ